MNNNTVMQNLPDKILLLNQIGFLSSHESRNRTLSSTSTTWLITEFLRVNISEHFFHNEQSGLSEHSSHAEYYLINNSTVL